MTALIILGCGYVGSRLARHALAANRTVRVTGRSTGKLAALGELGAEVKYYDATSPKTLPVIVAGLHGATVVYSIPAGAGPSGASMRNALQACYGAGAGCFIYLSSAGLYGPQPDDDVWIDEDTPIVHDDKPMADILTNETLVNESTFDRMRVVILRNAPIYGPGRGLRERLKAGQFRILDEGQHVTSRIHVDDAVRVIDAASERAPTKSTYLVADDEPTTQGEYAKWLCERLSLPAPPSRSVFGVGHRNRRIRNTRMKELLGAPLTYPTFRDGEAAIEAES